MIHYISRVQVLFPTCISELRDGYHRCSISNWTTSGNSLISADWPHAAWSWPLIRTWGKQWQFDVETSLNNLINGLVSRSCLYNSAILGYLVNICNLSLNYAKINLVWCKTLVWISIFFSLDTCQWTGSWDLENI